MEPQEVETPKMNKAPGTPPPPQVRQKGEWGKQRSAERVFSDTRDMLKEQEKIKIMIPSTKEDKEDVPVGVNGHTFLIKRDCQVEVPLAVVKVLESAKLTTYTQKKRENGEGMEMVPQEVLRFPFQRF